MGGRRGRLVSTEMGGESTVMEDGRSAAFVGALAEAGRFAATFANDLAGRSATFVGALAEAGGLVAGAAVFVGAFAEFYLPLSVIDGANGYFFMFMLYNWLFFCMNYGY